VSLFIAYVNVNVRAEGVENEDIRILQGVWWEIKLKNWCSMYCRLHSWEQFVVFACRAGAHTEMKWIQLKMHLQNEPKECHKSVLGVGDRS